MLFAYSIDNAPCRSSSAKRINNNNNNRYIMFRFDFTFFFMSFLTSTVRMIFFGNERDRDYPILRHSHPLLLSLLLFIHTSETGWRLLFYRVIHYLNIIRFTSVGNDNNNNFPHPQSMTNRRRRNS